jgi:hypothetical protein
MIRQWCLASLAIWLVLAAAGAAEPDGRQQDGPSMIEQARAQAEKILVKSAGERGLEIPRVGAPVMCFGDAVRGNQRGTLWVWGRSGRPAVMAEIYLNVGNDAVWIHTLTLTGAELVVADVRGRVRWAPQRTQLELKAFPSASAPAERASIRLRQMKDLARRLSAHEYWGPENSRYELRLLIQPVYRYDDADAKLLDGAVFVFAHGTNPEILLFIEARGDVAASATWQYGLARLGSAELHADLDGKEVYTEPRAPHVVGRPTDAYWLFSETQSDGTPDP